MPSYKKSLILCSLLFIFNGCNGKTVELNDNTQTISTFNKVKTKEYELENQYIMLALESENQRLIYDAIEIYFKLFQETNKYEYLVKYLTLSTSISDFKNVKEKASKYLISNIKEEEIILRLYIYSLFKLKENKEALLKGKELLSLYKNEINYELIGTIYLSEKEFVLASDLFEKAYVLSNSSTTLFTLTNVQYYNLSMKDKAIETIKKHIKNNGYDFNLSIQLLIFYDKEQKKEELVSLLKNMYFYYKKNDNQFLLNKTKMLFIKYFAKDNVELAITFLEENDEQDEILLNLYKLTNQAQKAYDLLNKLYYNSNNLDYLAQQAIIKFEMSEDKNIILNDVILKFDKVLETLDNHIYQNYLAYILIDFDIDIQKGLILVKKALKQEPDNLAYIDTLAWGEYKLNNCKEAYKNMKIVVDKIGLEDSEIKLHWEKIKECKE